MRDISEAMEHIDDLLATVLGNIESDTPPPCHGVGSSRLDGIAGEPQCSDPLPASAPVPDQWCSEIWGSSPLVPTETLSAQHAAHGPSKWQLQLPLPALCSIRPFDFYQALSSCSSVTLVEFPAKDSHGEASSECSSKPVHTCRSAAAPGRLPATKRSDHDKKERRLLSGTPHINDSIQAAVSIILSQVAHLTGTVAGPGTAVESFDCIPQFLKQCVRVQDLDLHGVCPSGGRGSGGPVLLGSVNVSTISMGRRATKSPLTAWKEGGQQDDTCCDGGSRPMESEIGQHGSFTELLDTSAGELEAVASGNVVSEQAAVAGTPSQVRRGVLVPAPICVDHGSMQRDHTCNAITTFLGPGTPLGTATPRLTDGELPFAGDNNDKLADAAAGVGKPDLVVHIIRKKRTSADKQSPAKRSVAPRLVDVGLVTSQATSSSPQVLSKDLKGTSGLDTAPGVSPRCASTQQATVDSKAQDRQLLRSVFHFPSSQAADKLGIGVTVLKRMCRSMDIRRWPYRELQRIQAMMNVVSRACSQCPEVSSLSADIRRVKGSVYDDPDVNVDHAVKELQQVLQRCRKKCKERQHHPGFVKEIDDEDDGVNV